MKYLSLILISLIVFVGATTKNELPEYKNVSYDFPIPIADTLAVLQLGSAIFNAPGSCGSCHNVARGGFSNEPNPIGGNGIFDYIMQPYDGIEPDKPMIRTPSIIMSDRNVNALSGGELGSGGLNTDLPFSTLTRFKDQNALSRTVKGIYVQAPVGNDAHRTTHLVDLIRKTPALKKMCGKAFADSFVNDFRVMVALGAYQSTVQPTQSNFAKSGVRNVEGLDVYRKKCASCHGDELEGQRLASAVDGSTLDGRIRLTKNPADAKIVKTTPLYNLKDAPCFFWHCEETTLYKAIGMCATSHDVELTRSEQHQLKRFLKVDAHDNNLDRYFDFTRIPSK